jgi:hypothetical protein
MLLNAGADASMATILTYDRGPSHWFLVQLYGEGRLRVEMFGFSSRTSPHVKMTTIIEKRECLKCSRFQPPVFPPPDSLPNGPVSHTLVRGAASGHYWQSRIARLCGSGKHSVEPATIKCYACKAMIFNARIASLLEDCVSFLDLCKRQPYTPPHCTLEIEGRESQILRGQLRVVRLKRSPNALRVNGSVPLNPASSKSK